MTDNPTTPEREAVARLEKLAGSLEALTRTGDLFMARGVTAANDAKALRTVLAILARGCPEGEPVGVTGAMPGTRGFTTAVFKAADVPVGTPLYAAPHLCPEGWRDIASAPKDGTKIVGMNARGEVFRMWWFLFKEGYDWQDDWDSEQRPVYWMPLPAAPQPSDQRFSFPSVYDFVSSAGEAARSAMAAIFKQETLT